MTLLLDTNVVSELRKIRAGKGDANVAAWARTVPAESLFLSVIVVQELEQGALLVERRDPAQGAILRSWLNAHVLPFFFRRILPVDMAVAVRCAAFNVPNPRPARDGLIAATAEVHGLTVVTRNIADFAPTGVPLLNPWTLGMAMQGSNQNEDVGAKAVSDLKCNTELQVADFT